MKKSNFKSKLTLKKESIANLDAMEMQNLQGGIVTLITKDLKKCGFTIGCGTIISNGGFHTCINC